MPDISASGEQPALRVLHLEDAPDDRQLVQAWMTAQNISAQFISVDNGADFFRAFERQTFDIVLSDKSLPGFDGLDALRFVREYYPHVPFVFVTGSMGEEAAIETLKLGATDYVLKDRLCRLIPAIDRALKETAQQAKSRAIEERNREQSLLLAEAQDAIIVTDFDDCIRYWNNGAERVFGWPAEVIAGHNILELLPSDMAQYHVAKEKLQQQGTWSGELRGTNRGGNELVMECRLTLQRDEQWRPKRILMIGTDVTSKKALEAKLLRSQRLDSIGALAGGIAHDLNNALAPVIMGAELLKTSDDAGERNKFIDIILDNAKRSTALVRHILSFARGSGGQVRPIALQPILKEIGKMIGDTFPKSISISLDLQPEELWEVQGDPTEIHQVLLNLCVNARDAMPEGGTITVSAKNVDVNEIKALAHGAQQGQFVLLSVQDTGTGIPPEVLPRIFEPFFTTKPRGKGTGLGLATVSSIVRRYRGFLDINTTAGKGTEFAIYLPAIGAQAPDAPEVKNVFHPSGQGECILLIEDEDTLRELTKATLESFGYRVVTAQNGLEGVARFKEGLPNIKVVITDNDMPHLNGLETIRAVREIKPAIPVMLLSGSAGDSEEIFRAAFGKFRRLEKPCTIEALLLALSEELKSGN